MSVVDLSYASRKPENLTILGLGIKGWMCGWATGQNGHPIRCGFLRVPDREEGEIVPPTRRVAMLFRALLDVCAKETVGFIMQEHQKSPTGPLWAVPAILSISTSCRYSELRDWMQALDVDERNLRSWATVALGQPPEHELVSQAMGIAAVGSREVQKLMAQSGGTILGPAS